MVEQKLESIMAKYLDECTTEEENLLLLDELEKSARIRLQLNMAAAALKPYKKKDRPL